MNTVMKQYLTIAAAFFAASTFTACMDDVAEPPVTDDNHVTCQESVGDINSTINNLKQDYRIVMDSEKQKNAHQLVDTNLVFRGVVVANDISGNLYQTLVLRDISSNGHDEFIQLGIKNTHLCPYFPLGTALKVNVKGLYVGNYSCVPKVGQPYYTSAGNLRLGPMLFELCRTHLEIIPKPTSIEPYLTPIAVDENWLKSNARNYMSVPALASIEGTLTDADGKTIFAPYELHDDGYGVNRDMKVGSTTVQVRTSTRNEVSYAIMPTGKVRITGVLSYYNSDWQITMRDLKDLEVLE